MRMPGPRLPVENCLFVECSSRGGGPRKPLRRLASAAGRPTSGCAATRRRGKLACATARRVPAGELLHLDIKKLARFWRPGHRVTGNRTGQSDGAGWEFVHIAIDDFSRIAYAEILGRESGQASADPVRLIVPMLERFIATDRGFVKARKSKAPQ